MRLKKLFCLLFAVCLAVGCLIISANATDNAEKKAAARFNGEFDVIVPVKSRYDADSSIFLASGDSVSIQAFFAPKDGKVKMGVIAPDGRFYGLKSYQSGINGTLIVSQSGSYTPAIRNNSSEPVRISGFIRY